MKLFGSLRRGQSSLEFVILIGFALIIISSLLVVFQNNLVTVNKHREDAIIDQMFNILLSEIDFAEMSMPYYNRTFYLPYTLGGYDYNVSIYDDVEVVLSFQGREYVRFLTEETKVVGNFSVPGKNFIVKECVSCNITLN